MKDRESMVLGCEFELDHVYEEKVNKRLVANSGGI